MDYRNVLSYGLTVRGCFVLNQIMKPKTTVICFVCNSAEELLAAAPAGCLMWSTRVTKKDLSSESKMNSIGRAIGSQLYRAARRRKRDEADAKWQAEYDKDQEVRRIERSKREAEEIERSPIFLNEKTGRFEYR